MIFHWRFCYDTWKILTRKAASFAVLLCYFNVSMWNKASRENNFLTGKIIQLQIIIYVNKIIKAWCCTIADITISSLFRVFKFMVFHELDSLQLTQVKEKSSRSVEQCSTGCFQQILKCRIMDCFGGGSFCYQHNFMTTFAKAIPPQNILAQFWRTCDSLVSIDIFPPYFPFQIGI